MTIRYLDPQGLGLTTKVAAEAPHTLRSAVLAKSTDPPRARFQFGSLASAYVYIYIEDTVFTRLGWDFAIWAQDLNPDKTRPKPF